MAKWRSIREIGDMEIGAVADLLMDDGKVIRATWESRPGTLGNCAGNKSGKILATLTAWWPAKGKWRGREMIGLYQPLSFRFIQNGHVE